MKLSELTETQKSHLVWRLDHKTCCGLLTAMRIAKGEFGDKELVDVFMKHGGKSFLSARIHAKKVINFAPPEKTEKPRRPQPMPELAKQLVMFCHANKIPFRMTDDVQELLKQIFRADQVFAQLDDLSDFAGRPFLIEIYEFNAVHPFVRLMSLDNKDQPTVLCSHWKPPEFCSLRNFMIPIQALELNLSLKKILGGK